MAVDIFLKIDDIKGESADKQGHGGEIEVLTWNWGLTQSGTAHTGTGSGAGKVNIQDITVSKFIDMSTPNLIKACCSGKPFGQALLTVRKAGGSKPVEYIKLKLITVIVSAVTTSGSGSDDRQTESVTLNFAKCEYTYTPQTDKGDAGPAITVAWNIPANTEGL
jgi:type VI secretion system secreted protein Hcp